MKGEKTEIKKESSVGVSPAQLWWAELQYQTRPE